MIKIIVSFALWTLSITAYSAETIKIGMSVALTGPVATMGDDMYAGVASYFQYINQQGGIFGRQYELIVRDDGYEPVRAASNTRALIDNEDVLALIGNLGTPTAIVTVPIAQEKKILIFGALSGADVLRVNPPNRYVINYRPSYAEETAEMVSGLLYSGIKPEEIAFFTQRDGYGDAGYKGAITALRRHGFNDVNMLAHGRYTRNTLNVEDAVAKMLDATIQPKAIIMAGSYAPSAKFIKLVREELPDVMFLNVSFVGSHLLEQALGNNVANVIVTQVVPSMDSNLSIVDEYLTILKQFFPDKKPNPVSLEGFIVAKLFHTGVSQIDGNLTTEKIVESIESLNGVDIGLGSDIYYAANDHQAIHQLWLTHLQSGQFTSFNWQQWP